jgi:radical SAM protein with 4Fe4S-binding SPASM domain
MSEYPNKVLLFADRVKTWESGASITPVTMDIELTYRCNHSCPWCVYSSLFQTDGALLPLDILKHCLDWASCHDVRFVLYSGGGEPTLHPRFRDVMAETERRNLDFGIFTNGSTLQSLVEFIPPHCKYLRISLDAGTQAVHTELHGARRDSFHHLKLSLERLRRRTPAIVLGLSFVVTEANCRDTKQVHALACDWGVNHVLFKREVSLRQVPEGFDISWAAEVQRSGPALFVRDLDPFVGHTTTCCHTSPLKAVVDAYGRLYICCARRSDTDMLGDLRNSSFDEIWGSSRHRAVWSGVELQKCPDCRMRQYNEAMEVHLKNENLAGLL